MVSDAGVVIDAYLKKDDLTVGVIVDGVRQFSRLNIDWSTVDWRSDGCLCKLHVGDWLTYLLVVVDLPTGYKLMTDAMFRLKLISII